MGQTENSKMIELVLAILNKRTKYSNQKTVSHTGFLKMKQLMSVRHKDKTQQLTKTQSKKTENTNQKKVNRAN